MAAESIEPNMQLPKNYGLSHPYLSLTGLEPGTATCRSRPKQFKIATEIEQDRQVTLACRGRRKAGGELLEQLGHVALGDCMVRQERMVLEEGHSRSREQQRLLRVCLPLHACTLPPAATSCQTTRGHDQGAPEAAAVELCFLLLQVHIQHVHGTEDQ